MAERILLGQLNSLGDCLLATPIARQIKHDFPGCHLVWAIGSMCRSVIKNNPWVDEAWEIPLNGVADVPDAWAAFAEKAREKQSAGEFRHVFMTQISPGNLQNYDGNIRGSIFRGYPRPMNVSVTPVLRLRDEEVERVRAFCERHAFKQWKHVVLIESSPASGQSRMTTEVSRWLVDELAVIHGDALFVISSAEALDFEHEQVADASVLSFRENAELANHCSLLVGGSSGISWLCTSDWVHGIPMIQWLDEQALWSNSMSLDFKRWGIADDSLIEFGGGDAAMLLACVRHCLENGFGNARRQFHEPVQPGLSALHGILTELLSRGDLDRAWHFIKLNARRDDIGRVQLAKFSTRAFARYAKQRLRQLRPVREEA